MNEDDIDPLEIPDYEARQWARDALETERRMSDPCPHSARRGRHEVYVRPDGTRVCRACGAGEAIP